MPPRQPPFGLPLSGSGHVSDIRIAVSHADECPRPCSGDESTARHKRSCEEASAVPRQSPQQGRDQPMGRERCVTIPGISLRTAIVMQALPVGAGLACALARGRWRPQPRCMTRADFSPSHLPGADSSGPLRPGSRAGELGGNPARSGTRARIPQRGAQAGRHQWQVIAALRSSSRRPSRAPPIQRRSSAMTRIRTALCHGVLFGRRRDWLDRAARPSRPSRARGVP